MVGSGIATSPQEQLLISLQNNQLEETIEACASTDQFKTLTGFLAIARPELLINFAHTFSQHLPVASEPIFIENYKSKLFEEYLPLAEQGNLSIVRSLPKFAMDIGQLAVAMELVLSHKNRLVDDQENNAHLQYLATFDPQHIGHRIAIQSALTTMKLGSQAVVHIMANHPFKPQLTPYQSRYDTSEERLYKSPLLNNATITQVNLPGNVGLGSSIGVPQMEMLADVSGDSKLRWLIGSDKFLLDTYKIRNNRLASKAIARFLHPRLEAYVVQRKSEDLSQLQNSIDYIHDIYGTEIYTFEELPYDCAPASSSRIKALRAAGDHVAADHMELYELAP